MFTSSAIRQALGLLVNIILARLLVPSDFGAVALVLSITGILQTFAEMGTSVALIQRQDVTGSVIDSAFVATLAVTLLIVAMLWAFSNTIGSFFALPVLPQLLKIAAVAYLFRGIFALYRCLFLRDMRYEEVSILDFSGYAIYGIIAIILAYLNFGPFSMVWAQLSWTITLLFLGIWRTKYTPSSMGNIKEIYDLLSFGVWVSVGRILRNASGKIDAFLIGKLLSASVLGSYHLAQRIVMLFPGTYTRIIDQVMLPIYSKWQKDLFRVEEGYWKALSYTALILIPPICLIFVFVDPLVPMILGGKWIRVIPLVRIISLFGLARVLGDGIFDSIVYGIGRPRIVTVMNTFRIITLPMCVIIGSKWGVIGIAWGLSAYGCIGRVFSQWLLKRYFQFSLLRFFREITAPLVAALFASGAVWGIFSLFESCAFTGQITGIIAGSVAWFIIYGAILRVLLPDKFKYLWEMAFQFMNKFSAVKLFGPIFQKK